MNYYHISAYNQNNKIFKPRIPALRLDSEDGRTKRVCFSTSIKGCLCAINVEEYLPCDDGVYYVHVPKNYRGKTHKPTVEEVPDVKQTREKWILNNVKLKCIGKIKVHYSSKRGLIFRWIEKYDK